MGAGNDDTAVIVGGVGAVGGGPSSNRTIQLESRTGDIKAAGAILGGFVFAGAGECALGSIGAGEMVVFDGMTQIRKAEVGEVPDGVTVKKLAVCFGGGYDPENVPFKTDDLGSFIYEEKEYEEEVEMSPAEYEDVVETKLVDGEQVSIVTGRKLIKERVVENVKRAYKGLIRNPDFDAEKHEGLEKTFVEMIGRNWAKSDGTATVGDYIGAEGKVVTNTKLGLSLIHI